MRRILTCSFVLISACCLTFGHGKVASADVSGSTNNGQAVVIPDNNSAGVDRDTTTVTITENEIIEDITFCIEGLDHMFIGDLVATVSHFDPQGNLTGTATLFSRVGRDTFGVGNSSNVLGNYAFNDDPSNDDLWSVAGDNTTDVDIPEGTYFPSNPNTGDWVLNLSDNNGTVEGTFTEFAVKFTSSPAIPEPSTLAILALGMGGLISIRRKRN